MSASIGRLIGVASLSLCAILGVRALQAADTGKAAPAAHASGKLTFLRLYTTPDGNSHFMNDAIELTPRGGEGIAADLLMGSIGDIPGAAFLKLEAGATEPYHIAPRRQFMICIRGIVEVTAGDGEKRRVLPGQFVLLEDTSGKGHITHAAGKEDHVALALPIADDVLAKK